MAEKPEEKTKTVIVIPLQTILVSFAISTLVSLVLFLMGPADLARAWFDSRATLMRAESTKRAIEIIGVENYFRSCDERSSEGR